MLHLIFPKFNLQQITRPTILHYFYVINTFIIYILHTFTPFFEHTLYVLCVHLDLKQFSREYILILCTTMVYLNYYIYILNSVVYMQKSMCTTILFDVEFNIHKKNTQILYNKKKPNEMKC